MTLKLFRPATLDLILTKMIRGDDPQDLADIAFLIRHDQLTPAQIESAPAERKRVKRIAELFEFSGCSRLIADFRIPREQAAEVLQDTAGALR